MLEGAGGSSSNHHLMRKVRFPFPGTIPEGPAEITLGGSEEPDNSYPARDWSFVPACHSKPASTLTTLGKCLYLNISLYSYVN